jgi:hypothetical protein
MATRPEDRTPSDPTATGDPRREGDNAVVEEWFGQSASRDAELADELVAEEGGDLSAAEKRFREQSTGGQEQHQRHEDAGS